MFHNISSRENHQSLKEAIGISHSYIIFNELIRTNKLYARNVSVIEGEWLSEFGARVFDDGRWILIFTYSLTKDARKRSC